MGTNFTPGRDAASQMAGSIGSVVLLALLDERADRLGRDQLHLVPKAGQHTSPVMRRAARLHDDCARCLLLEKRD